MLSRCRDQNRGRRCVRSTSNAITFAGKTYEISKLGKHLPLQKSYKLLPRKLFRDHPPTHPPFFRRKIPILFYPLARNSRNNPPIPVFQKIVCAIKFAIRKYVSIIRSKHVIMIYIGSIQKVNETRYIKKINIESTINRVHILKSISVET